MAKIDNKDLLEFLNWKSYPEGGLCWPANMDFIISQLAKKDFSETAFTREELLSLWGNIKKISGNKQ